MRFAGKAGMGVESIPGEAGGEEDLGWEIIPRGRREIKEGKGKKE